MKIVKVDMLLNVETDNQAYDAVNEMLKPLTHPAGSGIKADAVLIDYSLDPARTPNPDVVEDFQVAMYREGSFSSTAERFIRDASEGDLLNVAQKKLPRLGGFGAALSAAYCVADSTNQRTLREAFASHFYRASQSPD